MKHYKLYDLKIGMRVYVDELTEIEGVYILLSDTEDSLYLDSTQSL